METERLILRNYELAEKQLMIDLFTDEAVMKFVGDGVLSEKEAETLCKKLFEELYPKGANTIYGVFNKLDNRYIGHAAIRPSPVDQSQWEISYILRKDEWGKGFATEIAQKLVEFGLSELKLENVYATVEPENKSSIHILEKLGMKYLKDEYDEKGKYYLYVRR